jgi:hypothetical protein
MRSSNAAHPLGAKSGASFHLYDSKHKRAPVDERHSPKPPIHPDRVILAVVLACFAVELVILLLDVLQNVAQVWYFEHFRKLSNTALEKSFGTWFSVVQNFLVSLVALALSVYYRLMDRKRALFMAWLLVGLFFAYVSLDDHLVLHERISSGLGALIFQKVFGRQVRFATYKWLYLFGPFFAAFGLFFLIFLFRQLKSGKRKVILISALALWGIAVGLDAWEGAGIPYEGIRQVTGFERFRIRQTIMIIEEMLEMVGSTLFLYLFLSHLRNVCMPK